MKRGSLKYAFKFVKKGEELIKKEKWQKKLEKDISNAWKASRKARGKF